MEFGEYVDSGGIGGLGRVSGLGEVSGNGCILLPKVMIVILGQTCSNIFILLLDPAINELKFCETKGEKQTCFISHF